MKMTPEMFREIVAAVAEGERVKPLLQARKIQPIDFYAYLDESPENSQLYARASQAKSEIYAEDAVEIADTDDNPARARNRIDIRKWWAGKNNSKYNDKVEISVSGSIDLTAAIAEAQGRLGAPVVPSLAASNTQVIDITPEPEAKAPDIKSVSSSQEQDAGAGGPVDPFS